jgi:hypothetical protein
MRGEQVVEVLERLKHDRRLPGVIRVDNGSEFITIEDARQKIEAVPWRHDVP